MGRFFQTIRDFDSKSNQQILRKRPYGVINVVQRQLTAIHLKPIPKIISSIEASWAGGWGKKRDLPNQVQLFYNQPLGHRNFLALKYVVSSIETKWSSVATALSVLDWIATLKRSDAMVCELSNTRLSGRLMKRYGWQQHLENSRRPHYIKRFYGEYPELFLFRDGKQSTQSKNVDSQRKQPSPTTKTST